MGIAVTSPTQVVAGAPSALPPALRHELHSPKPSENWRYHTPLSRPRTKAQVPANSEPIAIRRRNDILAVVLPALTHVQYIMSLAQLSHDALACHLGTVVLLAAPPHNPAPAPAILGLVQHEKEGRR
jgi:hypothetical protein